ncbi:MAG TPA: hypothetical protein VF188_18015 [Longimicrobiales bacterium]
MAAADAGGAAHRSAALPPPGHGTLRQDDFTIALRAGALQVKVTPLAEEVIRLAAPDTYTRLHALAESRRTDAARVAGAPALFLVSFFSYQPATRFTPEDVQLVHQGRLLHPAAILPLTPGWGAQRLRQQETQSAVYVFDAILDFDLPLDLRYGVAESDAWTSIIPRLELERAKVRARAG